ncbi:MAG: sugar phosphate nucleotidyltransferase [Oligoflexales bacterium]
MTPQEIKAVQILSETSLYEAMIQMDKTGLQLLIVIDTDHKFLGVISDGDIRRQILKTAGVSGTVESCTNRSPILLEEGFQKEEAQELILKSRVEAVPVLSKNGHVVDIVLWDTFFTINPDTPSTLKTPVVIMAGGKGTRLDPFTRVLPKPLIPVGEKPILEHIIDRFLALGVDEFYIVLNYKGNLIKSWLESTNKPCKIHYIWEETPRGTGGGLCLLPKLQSETFILSNCDIMVDADYSDIVKFHQAQNNEITVIGSLQSHILPYGVVKFTEQGHLEEIVEKPKYTVTINTGIYVLETKALNLIPKDGIFHITDLITHLTEKQRKVGVYPVSETSYADIGQWKEYKKSVAAFNGDNSETSRTTI